jgi:alkaline phosphatase D
VTLLDTRYHRDPITRAPISGQRYFPDEEGDILGEAQWEWLKRELRTSTAQVHLIGTSIQAVSSQHPWSKWVNFPQARERLFHVIDASGVSRAVLLSGDRHIFELSRHDEAADPVTLRFEVRGTDNETLLDHTLSLSALRPSGGS